jgi:hypothetical protein
VAGATFEEEVSVAFTEAAAGAGSAAIAASEKQHNTINAIAEH